MSKPVAIPGVAHSYVEHRRSRIAAALGRPLVAAAAAVPLSSDQMAFFRREAEELYWNELDWEEITKEERVVGGNLTELVFPGLLTLVEGLLGAGSPRQRHPDAVVDILVFLEERYDEITAQLSAGADSEAMARARTMTARLIDLVLYRLYALSAKEREDAERRG